jgi:hypothetical protein
VIVARPAMQPEAMPIEVRLPRRHRSTVIQARPAAAAANWVARIAEAAEFYRPYCDHGHLVRYVVVNPMAGVSRLANFLAPHPQEVRFAQDSPLEGSGFELLVPLYIDAAGAGQMTSTYGAHVS